jgi:hypothetical protein
VPTESAEAHDNPTWTGSGAILTSRVPRLVRSARQTDLAQPLQCDRGTSGGAAQEAEGLLRNAKQALRRALGSPTAPDPAAGWRRLTVGCYGDQACLPPLLGSCGAAPAGAIMPEEDLLRARG